MIQVEHDLHRRRRSRNLGVGLLLALFIGIVFGLTVVKVTELGERQGFGREAAGVVLPGEEATK